MNVKKGQFMPPAEMARVVTKLEEGGSRNILLTERGTFFGYGRLVNDLIGLGDLIDLGRPVCFDVTHSTQLPGAGEPPLVHPIRGVARPGLGPGRPGAAYTSALMRK